MQKVADGHDTEVRWFFPSTVAAVDQLVPLQERALPAASTAMQKVADAHDTEVSWLPASMDVGADQLVPFQESACPAASTAIQRLDDAHDIAMMLPLPSMGLDQSGIPWF